MQHYYLDQMGIQAWVTQPQARANTLQLKRLAEQVATCTRCDLCKGRTQTVFGKGSATASLLIVGEAPGFHEDQQGQPFVGRAGQLLDQILQAMDISNDTVYIANVLKCRPPENRDPTVIEVQHCTPYLAEQIALIAPKIIVALGRHAAHYLLQNEKSLGQLRKQEFTYGASNTPLFVSYHPAYLLRNPKDKQQAYDDWCRIRQRLE